jgi:hypothetical protein
MQPTIACDENVFDFQTPALKHRVFKYLLDMGTHSSREAGHTYLNLRSSKLR